MTSKEVRQLGISVEFPKISMRTLFQPISLPSDRSVFTVLRFQKSVRESTVGTISFEPGTWGIMFNWEGGSVVRSQDRNQPAIIARRTILFSRANEMQVKVAKGDHESTFILWKSEQLPVLTRFVESSQRFLGYQPMSQALKQFQSSLVRDSVFELQIAGMVYNTMAEIMGKPDHLDLSQLPTDLPEVIRNLTQEVRRSPSHYWPVPEAARLAGYSSHHFSRIFKQLVGYGFQSYVERCRTEMAIEFLRSTDLTVDSVAVKSGFGATQALRDSLREQLGLMPSDLRPSLLR